MRVGIVGAGPRGLAALERLAARAKATRHKAPIAVELFDPIAEPGAGRVYRTDQPPHLTMNFADQSIDIWRVDGDPPVVPAGELRPFRAGAPGEESFSSRREVGRYLADSFALLLRHLPDSMTVNHRRQEVDAVDLRDGRPRLSAGGASIEFDQVLLTLGHGTADPESPGFPPAGRTIRPEEVDAGVDVEIFGAALTGFDSVLELTQGRGGTFEEKGAEARYIACGAEPRSITLLSRSGRSMITKPSRPAVLALDPRGDLRERSERDLAEAIEGGEALAGVFTALATRLLERTGRDPRARSEIELEVSRELNDRLTGPASAGRALDELRQSVRVAEGKQAPGAPWALGASWQLMYPDLVRLGGEGRIGNEAWARFRRLATEMERLAFGPPAVVARRLLALADAGFLRFGTHSGVPIDAGSGTALIWAVQEPPGLCRQSRRLLAPLIEAGQIVGPTGPRRGVATDDAGFLIGPGGSPHERLAALGRIAEDWIIGHDTLNRTLHDHPARWAERVLA